MTEEKIETKEKKEETCKCGKPLSECGCKDGKCKGDCKDGDCDCGNGDGCCGGHDHGHGKPELTLEQMTHSLNVLMNAMISLMVEKKLFTEQELHDKLVKDFGAQAAPKE